MASFFLESAAGSSTASSFSESMQSPEVIVAVIGAIGAVAVVVIPLVIRSRKGVAAPEPKEQGERDLATSYTELITWADGPVSESHPPSEAASCIRRSGNARVVEQADQISTLRQQSYDAMKTDAWLGKHEGAVSELKRLVQSSPPSRPSPP